LFKGLKGLILIILLMKQISVEKRAFEKECD